MYELKFTEKLCVMTMKNDIKIKEELTCRFKIDMRNFTNFDPSTRKSKKFVFYLAPCDQSIYCLSDKSTEELSFMTLKCYANFEEKLACGLKKDFRDWEIFTRALESVKIGTLMGYFCPKQKKYDLKIYRGVMCHDNEE